MATEIKLADIVLDDNLQPRVVIDQSTVNRYVEALTRGDKFPPVTIFHDGNNTGLQMASTE